MDPLTLLRPRAVFSKIVEGAGAWAVRYLRVESPGFGLVLQGRCYLTVDDHEPLLLNPGDFALVSPPRGFVMGSDLTTSPLTTSGDVRMRHGDPNGEVDFQLLGGYFRLDNAELLQDLLPPLVRVHADRRLKALVRLVTEEAGQQRPGRELVLERLVEVLLVEALRKVELVKGLADPDLGVALRAIHENPAHPWTVAELASLAGFSRSTFSVRFHHTVGMPPLSYVNQWRMALARDLLRRERPSLERVAEAVGYQSASAFSTAFRRSTGESPGQWSRRP